MTQSKRARKALRRVYKHKGKLKLTLRGKLVCVERGDDFYTLPIADLIVLAMEKRAPALGLK